MSEDHSGGISFVSDRAEAVNLQPYFSLPYYESDPSFGDERVVKEAEDINRDFVVLPNHHGLNCQPTGSQPDPERFSTLSTAPVKPKLHVSSTKVDRPERSRRDNRADWTPPTSARGRAKYVSTATKVALEYDTFSTVKALAFGSLCVSILTQNLTLYLRLRDTHDEGQLPFGIAEESKGTLENLLLANIIMACLALILTALLLVFGRFRKPGPEPNIEVRPRTLPGRLAMLSTVEELGRGFKLFNNIVLLLALAIAINSAVLSAYYQAPSNPTPPTSAATSAATLQS